MEHYGVTDLTQRVCKEIRPPDGIASDEDFYRQDNGIPIPNVSFLRLHFYQEGRLTEDQVLFLLRRVGDIFKTERNVLYLSAPITIVGDIHGQYYDLVNFMTSSFGGNPLKTDYLFLGDYVDRGYFSVECLLWLFALKLVKPNGINMLRGNHESKHLTNYFTFRIECTRKYSERIYDAFLEVFKTMPLAAVVDDRFFCVHGGIGPDLESVSDIDKVRMSRPRDCSATYYGLTLAHPEANSQVVHCSLRTLSGDALTTTPTRQFASFSRQMVFPVLSGDMKPRRKGTQCSNIPRRTIRRSSPYSVRPTTVIYTETREQ